MSETRDFWSRRKAAVEAEELAVIEAEQAVAVEAERAALAERDDAEILAELNLPDPDDLVAGDDISGFMSQVVPDRLRRRALRQLWKLNPALANLDGLIDYGEDYTDAATVIENMQTTYQVGKGMLAHVQEMARQEEAKAAAEAEAEELAEAVAFDDVDSDADTAILDPETTPEAEVPPLEVAGTAHVYEFEIPETDHTETAPPRRMRFEFEG